MPTTIERLPGEPILIIHSTPATGDIDQETGEALALIKSALDEQTEKVFVISDLREISMDLEQIIHATSMVARGRSPVTRHPNIRESISVLREGLIKMAIKGLDSATFGRVRVRIFDTIEEALDYCRGQTGPGF